MVIKDLYILFFPIWEEEERKKFYLLLPWPPDVKSWLIGKDPDAGKDWRQKEKRAAEDEMFRQYPWLNRHEFEKTPREWRTGEPGVLQSMRSQRIGHELGTEQQQ